MLHIRAERAFQQNDETIILDSQDTLSGIEREREESFDGIQSTPGQSTDSSPCSYQMSPSTEMSLDDASDLLANSSVQLISETAPPTIKESPPLIKMPSGREVSNAYTRMMEQEHRSSAFRQPFNGPAALSLKPGDVHSVLLTGTNVVRHLEERPFGLYQVSWSALFCVACPFHRELCAHTDPCSIADGGSRCLPSVL